MPARIEDVALKAGVSTKTVSRVFNREPNVSEKARTRVEAAARELSYRPNPSARSLAGNRSYLISLVYDDPAAGSSYIMEIIVGMLAACESSATARCCGRWTTPIRGTSPRSKTRSRNTASMG